MASTQPQQIVRPALAIKASPVDVQNVMYSAGQGVVVSLTGGIPRHLPILSLILTCEFRASVTTAATAVLPEAPFGMLQRIRVYGSNGSQKVGVQTLKDFSAATINAWNLFQRGVTSYTSGTLATGVGNYDIRFAVEVPFALYDLDSEYDRLLGVLNAPQWTGGLNLDLTFGGFSDLYNGGAGSVSAYGSGTGNPKVTVTVVQGKVGPELANFNPYYVRQIEQTVPSANVQTAGVDQLIQLLPTSESYHSILVKAYTANGGTGTAVASLLDNTLFSKLRVKVDTTPYPAANVYALDYMESRMGMVPVQSKPAGYNLVDFVHMGNLQSAFKTAGFAAQGKQFGLYGDINTVANAQTNLLLTTIKNAA